MADWSTPRVAPVGVRTRPRGEPLAARALDRESPLRRLDWILILAVVALCAIGTLLVWSATKTNNAEAGLDPQAYLKRNILNIAIGLVIGSIVALVDYRVLRSYAPILYGLACLGVLAVLVPHIGTTVNGAHAWIRLGGGFEVQPSEFAKLALIVLMATLLGERRDIEQSPANGDILLVLGLAAFPLLLVLLEPDLGMVLVLIFMIFAVIAMSGASSRWVLGLLVVGILGVIALLHLHLLKSYQVQRLTSFTHPNTGGGTFGYNTQQARITIGSGGLFGTGLFHGPQTNGHFVPEQQTDFVFTVAGEELGFVGSAVIVLLLGVVLWRAMRIAGQASDVFGMLIATGVIAWIAFQTFENIGMTMGIMPVTGLPLPFVSYGGSAMFATLAGVGLLQNVRMRARE